MASMGIKYRGEHAWKGGAPNFDNNPNLKPILPKTNPEPLAFVMKS
jgi:hypothetical protein